MKITIEHEGRKVFVEDENVVNMEEARELVSGVFVALGYHQDTVNDYFYGEDFG